MADVRPLVKLSTTNMTLADPAEDVRGRDVVDRNGDKIGTVDDLLLDEEEAKVRFLNVASGGFLGIGEDHFLVPVDAITRISDDVVRINRERSRLSDIPTYDPDVAYANTYYGDVYNWWEANPYWGPGYAYPPYPDYPEDYTPLD